MVASKLLPEHHTSDIFSEYDLVVSHLVHCSIETLPIPPRGTQSLKCIILFRCSMNPNKTVHRTVTAKDLQERAGE